MDFASAYTVFEKNERAKGICLANMGVIHYNSEEFTKAKSNFAAAALCAKKLCEKAKNEKNKDDFDAYTYIYCKRKYYEAVSQF